MVKIIGLVFLCLAFAAALLTSALFTGCMTVNPYGEIHSYQVQVITEPPGARIEVDGDLIGTAPMTVTFSGFYDRTFNKPHTVVAYPIEVGHCLQHKQFVGGYSYYDANTYQWVTNSGSSIPQTMFFDVRLCVQPPALNVNVK